MKFSLATLFFVGLNFVWTLPATAGEDLYILKARMLDAQVLELNAQTMAFKANAADANMTTLKIEQSQWTERCANGESQACTTRDGIQSQIDEKTLERDAYMERALRLRKESESVALDEKEH